MPIGANVDLAQLKPRTMERSGVAQVASFLAAIGMTQ